jgi:2-polyprenyl-6-methoxyphenol hydroxylase-like FAD-dependent oxidoreductase
MRVLLVGAGVIGTVYGSHLAADGHQVSVLGHGPRTGEVARDGLAATDLDTGARTAAPVCVLDHAGAASCDLVPTAGRRRHIEQPEHNWWPWPECPQIIIVSARAAGGGPPGARSPRSLVGRRSPPTCDSFGFVRHR